MLALLFDYFQPASYISTCPINVIHAFKCFTFITTNITIDALKAAIQGLTTLDKYKEMEICSIQEYHRHAPKLSLSKLDINDLKD